MGNRKLTRLLALILAVACTLTVVAALSYDYDNDGIVNVWDIQKAPEAEKAGALIAALGGANELQPVSEGYYEIYSPLGLYSVALHATEGATFKLMNDIDLGGAEWFPVKSFTGTFDGNKKSISNLKITTSTYGSDGDNMGFFADTRNKDNDTDRTVIQNLNLKDVEIVIGKEDKAVCYVGGIVGTNRGDVKSCTVTCAVTDERDMLAASSYIGSQVGRNATRKVDDVNTPNGTITGSNSLEALQYYDYPSIYNFLYSNSNAYKSATKVNSQMAMFFTELQEGSAKRNVGIAGFSNSQISSGLLMQDTTNSSKYDDPELLARRTKVTETMYEMSTVEWTPSKDLLYVRRTSDPSQKTWKAGDVVRGLPYNHGSAGIDRFLAYMEVGANGRYTTVSTLPTVAGYYTLSSLKKDLNTAFAEYNTEGTTAARKNELLSAWPELAIMDAEVTGIQNGFNMYIGADCSSQASWAWRSISASKGTDFTAPTSTSNMYISEQWITKTGIVPVNNFILEDVGENSAERSKYIKAYTREHKDEYMEALTHVTKGDLLMCYTDEGGHTLVAMSDAIVIRKSNGSIDTSKCYIITAEMGGGGGTRKGRTSDGKTWTSQCCVDRQTTFDNFFSANGDANTTETPGVFFPITCTALKVVDTPAATATCKMSGGKVSSNFHIVSTTVGGETVYTMIQQSNHREACTSLTVADAHPDVKSGDVVQVKLSNGNIYEFTY